MKLTTRKGKVLIDIYQARIVSDGRIFYDYRGDGCGGTGPIENIMQTFNLHRECAPRAVVSGSLPEVTA